ncbi:MAG: hypothetical protein KDD64_06530 [Bdellovibrionales bacterium]|nr:hypothetical protein [Bdellovibrionales bacterium]
MKKRGIYLPKKETRAAKLMSLCVKKSHKRENAVGEEHGGYMRESSQNRSEDGLLSESTSCAFSGSFKGDALQFRPTSALTKLEFYPTQPKPFW